jgi:hypothetical protein
MAFFRQHPDFKTRLATSSGKSVLKRDGPVFFSPAPAKVAGDETTIIAIVAPHRGVPVCLRVSVANRPFF